MPSSRRIVGLSLKKCSSGGVERHHSTRKWSSGSAVIPMSFQDETKARRIFGLWRDASEAHIRRDPPRASNEARGQKDKRISLILKAIWNKHQAETVCVIVLAARRVVVESFSSVQNGLADNRLPTRPSDCAKGQATIQRPPELPPQS